MGPSHHPAQEELLGYATGSCETWLSTLIACHLTLCPACRDEVAWLEAVGGALVDSLLDDHGQAPLDCAERVHVGIPPPAQIPNAPKELAGIVPRPLLSYLSGTRPRFRFLAPGLAHMPLSLMGGGRPVLLVRFAPGFVVPQHGHSALEWLLILSGEVSERGTGERFARGDICRREASDVHTQVVGRGEPCIAAIATLGSPVPHTLLGKLLARVIGL